MTPRTACSTLADCPYSFAHTLSLYASGEYVNALFYLIYNERKYTSTNYEWNLELRLHNFSNLILFLNFLSDAFVENQPVRKQLRKL